MSFKITAASLKRHLKENKQYWCAPDLNDVIHLQCKGIEVIENLENLLGLRTLYLESNAIALIQGLEQLTNLRSLYLARNLISTIEGLATLCNLETLDLSENCVTRVENLSCLTNLKTLNLASNRLSCAEDIKHLSDCTSVISLDLSNNKLAGEDVMELVEDLPLLLLRLQGNPVVSSTRSYRKRLLASMPSLNYLDDSPCFPRDRRLAQAFCSGGLDAERAERDQIRAEEDQRREEHMKAFDEMVRQAKLSPPAPSWLGRFHAAPEERPQERDSTEQQHAQSQDQQQYSGIATTSSDAVDDSHAACATSASADHSDIQPDAGAGDKQQPCAASTAPQQQAASTAQEQQAPSPTQQQDSTPHLQQQSIPPMQQQHKAAQQQSPTVSPPGFHAELQQRAQQRSLARAAVAQALYESAAVDDPCSPTAASSSRKLVHMPSQRQQLWGTDAYAALWEKAKQLGELQEQMEQQQAAADDMGTDRSSAEEEQELDQQQCECAAAGDDDELQQECDVNTAAIAHAEGSIQQQGSAAAGSGWSEDDEDEDDEDSWSDDSIVSDDDPLARYTITSFGQGIAALSTSTVGSTDAAEHAEAAAAAAVLDGTLDEEAAAEARQVQPVCTEAVALPAIDGEGGQQEEAVVHAADVVVELKAATSDGAEQALSATEDVDGSEKPPTAGLPVVCVESIDLFELD